MNPYEANLRNVSARLGAWARGMVRLYRKPLIVLLLAGLSTAVGVSAAQRDKAVAMGTFELESAGAAAGSDMGTLAAFEVAAN